MIKKVIKSLPKVETIKKYPQYLPTNSKTFEEEVALDEDINVCVNVKISQKIHGVLEFDVNELPYCCGIYELGNIGCTSTLLPLHINHILDNCVASTKKTVIINTNGRGSCIPMERALAVSKSFTLVKTFNNPTGSTVKIWISNNC